MSSHHYSRGLHIFTYAIVLTLLVGSSIALVTFNGYIRDYLEGFLGDRFHANNPGAPLRPALIHSDEVQVWNLDWADKTVKERSVLPAIIDSLMKFKPRAVGLDFDLEEPGDPVTDSILLATILRYDNIVLKYDLFADVGFEYPLGLTPESYDKLGYVSFGTKANEARYLGSAQTVGETKIFPFWIRLWTVGSSQEPGSLSSKRRFINYDLKPLSTDIRLMEDITGDSTYRVAWGKVAHDKIVIIGKYVENDLLATPVRDVRHFTMHGAKVIGTATLTVGENELTRGILDRFRYPFGALVYLFMLLIFILIHFCKKPFFRFVRSYGNCLQAVSAVCLYFFGKALSPSADEYFLFFCIVALVILWAPATGELADIYQRSCSKRKTS
ncbi:MAG: CHASE2 domain-containing protein [Bacteroidales bacterium]|nr:CHASE2 domain-containing protein [Bacteroidales bacterium]